MKQYQMKEDGSITIDGMTISSSMDNRHYVQALEEVSKETAEILPYLRPINKDIDKQISDLESTLTPRRIREATLTSEGKIWLQNLDDQIKTLTGQRISEL